MKYDGGRRVYRSQTQSFGMVMCAFVLVVLIGSGVARNIDRVGLAVFGIILIVLGATICLRGALAGIIVSESGIRVRNIFSSAEFSWKDIDRFEIDKPGTGMFPQICRVCMTNGKVKRAVGICETNYALARSPSGRPGEKIVAELNDELSRRRAPDLVKD
jgi:hypothetical protein